MVTFFLAQSLAARTNEARRIIMAESQELKLIGGKGHKVGCMCKMCLRIWHNWAKGQEKMAKGFQTKVSGPKLKKQGFVQAFTDKSNPATFGNASKSVRQ